MRARLQIILAGRLLRRLLRIVVDDLLPVDVKDRDVVGDEPELIGRVTRDAEGTVVADREPRVLREGAREAAGKSLRLNLEAVREELRERHEIVQVRQRGRVFGDDVREAA